MKNLRNEAQEHFSLLKRKGKNQENQLKINLKNKKNFLSKDDLLPSPNRTGVGKLYLQRARY